MRRFLAPFVAVAVGLLAASDVHAFSHGGGAVVAASIPTITAGSAQPGNTTAANSYVFSTWGPLSTGLLSQQGSAGLGFNDNAIAVWDAPQYALMSGAFNICVIGYHSSGTLSAPLVKVAFFLDNGPEVDVSTSNFTHFGAAEYCVKANDANLAEGPHEMRAIAYPVRGYPRALSSTMSATTGGNTVAKVHNQAHGVQSLKIVQVSNSSDGNFTNGYLGCVMYSGDLGPSDYDLAPFTGAYPNKDAYGNQGCGATATTATTNSTITINLAHAGLDEAQPTNGGSLWFQTNHNLTLFPGATANVYVDSVSGSDSQDCLEATHTTGVTGPCATISHAITAMVPAADGGSFTFTNGSSTITSGGSAVFLANQAVVLSGAVPLPYLAGRPYWVINPVVTTSFQLALEPGGATVGSVTGSTGSVKVNADYSNFTVNLECSGACASPSTYVLSGTHKSNLYGWFNIIPLAGTAHANTVINTGSAVHIADKVHFMVDLTDDFNNAMDSDDNGWGIGSNDVWGDTLTETGACQSCFTAKGSWLGHLLFQNYYGFQQFTNVTINNSISLSTSGTGGPTTVIGGTVNNSGGGGFDQVKSLQLGTTMNNIGIHTLVAMPLSSYINSTTLDFDSTALPAPLLATPAGALGPAAVGSTNNYVAFKQAQSFTYPQSGCLSTSVNDSLNGYSTSPNRITLNSAVASAPCVAGDFIPLGEGTHSHSYTNFVQPNYGTYTVGNLNNMILAYNTCTNCQGPSLYTQGNGGATALNLDVAYIGNYVDVYQGGANRSIRCTTSPNNTDLCLWTTQAFFEPNANHNNFLLDGNTFTGGFVTGLGSTFTDAVWRSGNVCKGTARGKANAILKRAAGWTFQAGGGC